MIPTSVNYHLTRKCNYKCRFCFHTDIDSYVEPLERAKHGLRLLKEAGMKKINFAGGEPFLEPVLLGELCRYARETLNTAVSIVTNGSKARENWFTKYGQFVDIIAVSCDSFHEDINIQIGRGTGNHLQAMERVAELCRRFSIRFKINTVVNRLNWEEDMNDSISRLNPFRWKVFQVLIIEGENDGDGSKRDASDLTVSSDQFRAFLNRHRSISALVPEGNDEMRSSYLLLDEHMRFLNCSGGQKTPTASILDVGVMLALVESGFDQAMFLHRGGVYDYSSNTVETAPDIEDCARY